jgi:hypothetical protein
LGFSACRQYDGGNDQRGEAKEPEHGAISPVVRNIHGGWRRQFFREHRMCDQDNKIATAGVIMRAWG